MLSLWQQRQTYSIDPSGLQLALQIYSVEFHLIYTAFVTRKVVWSLSPKKARVPFHRKEPWAEQGSKGGTLLLVSRGGGQKAESNRHLEQTSLGCCGVTLAFRTVQWSELVPLSYKRSNSNVPKEAVITISATLLYSITSTYILVNSQPPHTPNCPLSCMHFYSVNLKNTSCKKAEEKSSNPKHSLIFQIYFQSHYSAITDDTLTYVC